MASPSHLLLIFFSVFLALLPEATPLQPSQVWTLIKIQQLLNSPPMLSHWRHSTDFCGGAGGFTGPTGSAAVLCYGDTVTQLHIAGTPGSPPLPRNFSVGALVTTLSRLPDLKVLTLSSIGLWGPLPGKLGRLASLEIVNVSGNYLYGDIPKGMSRLASLQTLVLDDNLLGGELPAWIGAAAMPSLSVLSLRNNTFRGAVPESIGTMPSLRSLVLASNNISGNLPDMSRAANLQVLDVSGNSLGPAFPKLGRKVVSVVLSRNRFGGGLPAALGSFYLLERLDVSWNRFVGPFTPALLSLPSIRYLSIAGNRFTGMLSGREPCGDNLRFVDLSLNLLMGSVPTCLRSPERKPATVVLVSTNCLDSGGDDGSQRPSPFCQNQALAVGIVPGKERKSVASQAGFVAGIVVATLAAVSVVALIVFFAVRRAAVKGSKARALATSEEESSSTGYPSKLLADARYISQTVKLGALGIPSYRSFSLVELEAATNNFENSYLLGQDSLGEMYRGQLGNGTPVTIRTLKIKRSQTTQSLNRHIETISRLRHQNLVSALGHCFEYDPDNSTVTQLYIVFEYVQNGNLRSRISQGTEGCKLTWSQRISAAIGVAKGIQFLHGGIIPGLVGNDLRITNILLDQNHVAKIGSYNIPILAEAMKSEGGAGNKFQQTDSPLYRDKTDIFDFGVILLEVVSGKTITSMYEVDILKELLAWAIADEDRVRRRSFADPAVNKGCSDESLRTIMEICQRCLAKEPAQRPSVEDVLWNLQFAAQVQDDWEVDAWSSGGGSPVSSSSRVTRPSRLNLSR